MTARDEAIAEIADIYHTWQYGDNGTSDTRKEADQLAKFIVRNFPPGVLARLAIEQGALEHAGVHRLTGEDVYRVVEL